MNVIKLVVREAALFAGLFLLASLAAAVGNGRGVGVRLHDERSRPTKDYLIALKLFPSPADS
jgi:hypothetical protein